MSGGGGVRTNSPSRGRRQVLASEIKVRFHSRVRGRDPTLETLAGGLAGRTRLGDVRDLKDPPRSVTISRPSIHALGVVGWRG
jgi:hypothetical protein